MIKRKQNGFVIELIIVFMLVTFGFCMVMTTYLGSLNVERKYAKQSVNMQTDLNQIGEYYLRYIEESGEQFPSGTETNFSNSKYNWMDNETKEFFKTCNQTYHFKFEPKFSIVRGNLLEFYKTKYIWRKLVIKSSNNKIKMIIELKEQRVSDNETEYYVQNWSVGDELTDETETSGGYEQDNLSTLQKLWMFLGLEIDHLTTWQPTGKLSGLVEYFNQINANWRTAMEDGI